MVTILILWQHRVALKAFFRQWKMSISICYRACTFLCNKRLLCSYYFIATLKILPYRVALQRSSVAVWRRGWHRKGGTQHIFGWGSAPVTQILTVFKNKLNKFSLTIFDTQHGTFSLKQDPVSDKKIIVLAWGTAGSD